MTDWEAARQALFAKYGKPEMADADATARALRILGNPDGLDESHVVTFRDGLHLSHVVAFRYPSREAAQEWQQLNADHHGHEPVGIVPTEPNSTEVIGVMSIRAQLAEHRDRQRDS